MKSAPPADGDWAGPRYQTPYVEVWADEDLDDDQEWADEEDS